MPPATPRHLDRRTPLAVVGLLLLAAMAFLLLHGPRFETSVAFGDESVAVSCGSVLTVGWPSDHSSLSSETSRSYGDHIRSGKADFAGRDGIARDCSERRDTYLGFLGVLAVPTSVCLSALLRPRQPSSGQTTSV